MGFPPGLSLANGFMCHLENIWLENCPSHFKPIIYRRFVDKRTKDHADQRTTLRNLETISTNNIKT